MKSRNEILVYLAGPYRAAGAFEININIQQARYAAYDVWRAGYTAICPHLNTAHFDGLVPDGQFLDGDLEILSRCDVLYVFNNDPKSSGVRGEIAFAYERGIPIATSVADIAKALKLEE